MSVWVLAVLGWVVVFPVLVVGLSVLLSMFWRRSIGIDELEGPCAEVIPFAVRRASTARQIGAQGRDARRAPVA